MKRMLILAFVFFMTITSYASDDDRMGYEILRCFHPTGSYESITLEQVPSDYSLKNKSVELNGKVRFRGGFSGNPYYMKFIFHLRFVNNALEYRIEPTVDTAPFPPNPRCYLRGWNDK